MEYVTCIFRIHTSLFPYENYIEYPLIYSLNKIFLVMLYAPCLALFFKIVFLLLLFPPFLFRFFLIYPPSPPPPSPSLSPALYFGSPINEVVGAFRTTRRKFRIKTDGTTNLDSQSTFREESLSSLSCESRRTSETEEISAIFVT